MIGFSEIILILLLVLLLFGPSKLPEVGKWLGIFMREIQKYSSFSFEDLAVDEEKGANSKTVTRVETKPLPETLTESPDIVRPDYTESMYMRENAPEQETEKADMTDIT